MQTVYLLCRAAPFLVKQPAASVTSLVTDLIVREVQHRPEWVAALVAAEAARPRLMRGEQLLTSAVTLGEHLAVDSSLGAYAGEHSSSG